MSLPLQPTPSNLKPLAAARPAPASAPPAEADAAPVDQVDYAKSSEITSGGPLISPIQVASTALTAPAPSPGEIPHQNYLVDANGCVPVKLIYDNDKRTSLSNLTAMGSWDSKGHYTTQWSDSLVKMTPGKEPGTFEATVNLVPGQKYQWGALADGPSGPQQFAMFGEEPPSFTVEPGTPIVYAPRTYAQMGVTQSGDDARVKVWGGKADNVSLQVYDDPDKEPRTIPLQKGANGMWATELKDGWKDLVGKPYGFAVTADGQTKVHADPYARQLLGQLRGVGDAYLNPTTGQEVNKFWSTTDASGVKQAPLRFHRFDVQQQPDADKVLLRLSDANGNPLSKTDLEKRLGTDGGDLARKFEGDFWHDTVSDDGAISLTKKGSDAWATLVNNTQALEGLRYDFEVYKKDASGKSVLVGDANGDGKLSRTEARQTTFNDPFDNTIKEVGNQRLGVVKSDDFDWKNPAPPFDKKKAIIYQAHVGSFMGEANNVRRSTFKDMIDNLDYFKDMGFNTIELLPTNPFEGESDWGYLGTSSMAVAEQYGFTDDDGKWVCGADALKRFIDAAHGKGLSVMDDVVYNHFGGEFNNLWEFDGKANSYYNDGSGITNTDWGAMGKFKQSPVSQLVTDSAMSRVDNFHFDGERYDFTDPMHRSWGGGEEGTKLLRSTNRQLHFLHPTVLTSAENFPNESYVVTPSGPNMSGGLGFDTMWNTEFQHRLVHDGSNPSIIQQAASGQSPDVDKFLYQMTDHPGFPNDNSSITVFSNHDEVGNADRTMNVIRNYREEGRSTAWERGISRMAFGTAMLAPGIPIVFQGDEKDAINKMKWGIPSTWDPDLKLPVLDVPTVAKAVSEGSEDQLLSKLNATKAPGAPDLSVEDMDSVLKYQFTKDAIALRKSSPAFDADVPAHRVYTHRDNGVFALSRESGLERYIVIGSLNHNAQANYNIPIADGKWELVLDSDSKDLGGTGNARQEVDGGQGASFNLPAGGLQVYKKIA